MGNEHAQSKNYEGFVLGDSDSEKLEAYPIEQPVSPGDLVATMYNLVSVDSQMMLPADWQVDCYGPWRISNRGNLRMNGLERWARQSG